MPGPLGRAWFTACLAACASGCETVDLAPLEARIVELEAARAAALDPPDPDAAIHHSYETRICDRLWATRPPLTMPPVPVDPPTACTHIVALERREQPGQDHGASVAEQVARCSESFAEVREREGELVTANILACMDAATSSATAVTCFSSVHARARPDRGWANCLGELAQIRHLSDPEDLDRGWACFGKAHDEAEFERCKTKLEIMKNRIEDEQRARYEIEQGKETGARILRAIQSHGCPVAAEGAGKAGPTPPLSVMCAAKRGGLGCDPRRRPGPGEYLEALWTEDPVWSGLDFELTNPHHFHFEVEWSDGPTPDQDQAEQALARCRATVRAYADLDADGEFSIFERSVEFDGNRWNSEPWTATRELE